MKCIRRIIPVEEGGLERIYNEHHEFNDEEELWKDYKLVREP